ncbi:MAG: hypothetical protein ACRDQZ_06655, partial [Mycobacteriales bacterium]
TVAHLGAVAGRQSGRTREVARLDAGESGEDESAELGRRAGEPARFCFAAGGPVCALGFGDSCAHLWLPRGVLASLLAAGILSGLLTAESRCACCRVALRTPLVAVGDGLAAVGVGVWAWWSLRLVWLGRVGGGAGVAALVAGEERRRRGKTGSACEICSRAGWTHTHSSIGRTLSSD